MIYEDFNLDFHTQRCGAARTINQETGKLAMMSGVPYKTHFGYKIYSADDFVPPQVLILAIDTDNETPIEVIISDSGARLLSGFFVLSALLSIL